MKLWIVVAFALLGAGCSPRGCVSESAPPDARAATPTPSRAPTGEPVAVVAQALVDFESQLVWPDAGPSLPEGREGWLRATRSARTPQELATQVVLLERAIGADGLLETWAAGREAWVGSMVTPTPASLARAVRQLGESVREGHVAARWRDKRGPWVERLASVP
jgi:hypothetical protein